MADSLTLKVPAELDGQRLDKVLATLLDVSRAMARSLVEEGAQVDGVPGSADTRVSAGAVIVAAEPPPRQKLSPEPVDFDVIYEDDDVVVVDKPAGVVVHPGSKRRSGTLAAGLLHRYPEIEGVGAADRWGLVHRLDKDTSGALLVARNTRSFDMLGKEMRARRVNRRYVALVDGVLRPPTGTIDAPIGRDPAVPTRRAVGRDGKPATTHYQVRSNYEADDVALVDVELETGRTHQIRVHFAAIGHPVVGDTTYGSGRSRVEVPRIFLHARQITFTHPTTGEAVVVEAPLPQDLQRVVSNLGEAGSV